MENGKWKRSKKGPCKGRKNGTVTEESKKKATQSILPKTTNSVVMVSVAASLVARHV